MIVIPDTLAQSAIQFHGEPGRAWLARLPEIVAACAARWRLAVEPPFPYRSVHYVAPAVRDDGARVVLKVHSPTGEFADESEALRWFDGRAAVRMLERDTDLQAMLLERLEPATNLLAVENDAEATAIAAAVMRRLWRPAPRHHPFPTVERWGLGFERLRREFHGGSGPFPPKLVDEAEALYAELAATAAEPALLHGDLHHENVLAAQREPWLVIDPKGLIGEPAYETGALLRNRLEDVFAAPDPIGRLRRRAEQLADELGFDRARVIGWALAQVVLAGWWCYEDGDCDWDEAMACGELFAAMKAT